MSRDETIGLCEFHIVGKIHMICCDIVMPEVLILTSIGIASLVWERIAVQHLPF